MCAEFTAIIAIILKRSHVKCMWSGLADFESYWFLFSGYIILILLLNLNLYRSFFE